MQYPSSIIQDSSYFIVYPGQAVELYIQSRFSEVHLKVAVVPTIPTVAAIAAVAYVIVRALD